MACCMVAIDGAFILVPYHSQTRATRFKIKKSSYNTMSPTDKVPV